MKKNEAAFPNGGAGEDGLTKLEWFAGHAMAGILAGGYAETVPHDHVDGGASVAFFAFQYAGAMVLENERLLGVAGKNPPSNLDTAIEAMEKALQPFADISNPRMVADHPITQFSGIAKRSLTMGDCQRAAQALEALKRARAGQ